MAVTAAHHGWEVGGATSELRCYRLAILSSLAIALRASGKLGLGEEGWKDGWEEKEGGKGGFSSAAHSKEDLFGGDIAEPNQLLTCPIRSYPSVTKVNQKVGSRETDLKICLLNLICNICTNSVLMDFVFFFVQIHFRGNIFNWLACFLVVDIIVKINNLLLLNKGGLRV